MMVFPTLLVVLAFLFSCMFGVATEIAEAEDLVREDRIKVFLYAAPAYWREVAVDGYKDTCTALTNNLFVYSVDTLIRRIDEMQHRWSGAVNPDWGS